MPRGTPHPTLADARGTLGTEPEGRLFARKGRRERATKGKRYPKAACAARAASCKAAMAWR